MDNEEMESIIYKDKQTQLQFNNTNILRAAVYT